MKIARFSGCKNCVSERENFIFDAFVYLYPFENGFILVSFRYMTTGRTTDDGRTDVANYRISDPVGGPAITPNITQ